MSKTIDTASALIAVLANGEEVMASDLRDRVIDEGGDPAYIQIAAKHLRDLGVPVMAKKARHLSTWHIASDTDALAGHDSDQWVIRVRAEHYSEAVSTARALSGSKAMQVQAVRQTIMQSAINLGLQMGKTIAEVVEECNVPDAGAA